MAAKKKKQFDVDKLYQQMEESRMDRALSAIRASPGAGKPVAKGSIAEFSLKRGKRKGYR